MSDKQETVRSIIRMQTPGKGQKSIQYTYACECGKSYGTYPALYLHFKRTHHMKITTRISGVENQAMKVRNQRIFTYFFSKKEEKSEQGNFSAHLPRNSVELVFQQFLKQAQGTRNYSSGLGALIIEFQSFVIKHYEPRNLAQQNDILMEIPNFFNSFVQQKYLYLKQKQLYAEFCGFLLRLGQWLRLHRYTHYIVMPEQNS